MQTPFTMCIPGPQALRTLTNISSGACSGARGIARADDMKAKASIATIHLTMASLLAMAAHPRPFAFHSTRLAAAVR
jgi:predicted metal-binding protein